MTMTSSRSADAPATATHIEEDPVRAAVERARLRPPMPAEERDYLLSLAVEGESRHTRWLSDEEFTAELDALRPSGSDDE